MVAGSEASVGLPFPAGAAILRVWHDCMSLWLQALREALDYNYQLEQLSSESGMPKGLSKTNIYGGKFAAGDKDMRELYRTFVEESLRTEGKFSEQLEQDVSALQQTLALGTKEANSLRDEISSKVYR